MVRRKLDKIENPQLGIYSVRYRTSKGKFTKSLSATSSFQYVTKAGDLSRPVKIPKNFKSVAQKRLFIYAVLGSTINRIEKTKETVAKKKNKTYTKNRPEELLNIPPSDLEILRQELPEIFPRPEEEYYQLIGADERQRRVSSAAKYDKEKGVPIFDATVLVGTTGKRTNNLLGDPASWMNNQKKIGLIKEVTETKERSRKNKKTGKVTKYKVKQKVLYGDGSIMFLFTRTIRKFFMENRDAFLKGTSKRVTQYSFKFSIVTNLQIHDEYMLSDQSFMLPRRLSKKAYKRKIDGMVWRMAQECFRLLNDDFPSDDEPKGGLTSDDIFTKIKYSPELLQAFGMRISLIIVPSPIIPKSVIDSVRRGTKAQLSKARYEIEEDNEDDE
jgi:hypothetical protein